MKTIARLGLEPRAPSYQELKSQMRDVNLAIGQGARFRIFFPVNKTEDDGDYRFAFALHQVAQQDGDLFMMLATEPFRWMYFESDSLDRALHFEREFITKMDEDD